MLETVRTGKSIAIFVAAALVLGACSTPTPPPIPTTPPTAIPTLPPAATETPPAPAATAVPDVGVPVIEPPAPGDPAAMANYNTYIFGGPGTEYVVYGALLGGESAKVVGISESGTWWAISVPPAPQAVGWLDGAWVTASNVEGVSTLPSPPVPPTTALVPPASGDPQATVLVNTYVRAGPGATFAAYGIGPAGATARVLGKSQDGLWWVVRLNPEVIGAGYGWVSGSTVQASNVDAVPVIQAPPPPPQAAPVPPPAGVAAATAIDYLNVRSGAGTCYSAYGVAPPGASAEVAGKSSDGLWWQVKIPTEFAAGGLGWVSSGYVMAANTDAVPVVETQPCPDVPAPTPAPYACALSSQTPEDYADLAPGTTFDMTWVVQNRGDQAWTESALQFILSGAGGSLHTSAETIAIPDSIGPGGTYTAAVPALTPADTGSYGELWQIQMGDTPVCEFWLIIDVVE